MIQQEVEVVDLSDQSSDCVEWVVIPVRDDNQELIRTFIIQIDV